MTELKFGHYNLFSAHYLLTKDNALLDPSSPIALDLSSFEAYLESCRKLAEQRLARRITIEQLMKSETKLNCYPGLAALEEPRGILILEDEANLRDVTEQSLRVLEGKVLWEHTCAGEATRLGLGAKYLIVPPKHLSPDYMGKDADISRPLAVSPSRLNQLSLGQRHMLQQAWNIWLLAESMGQDARQVLKRQHLLIIVNKHTATQVMEDFVRARFYGFNPGHVLFMVQHSFAGLRQVRNKWQVEPSSPKRLHNHGQMVMQTLMDNQIFYIDENLNRHYFLWDEYLELLRGKTDKVSFNIEDLDYLNDPIDMLGLAAAHNLGLRGYQMVMEVVANSPENPIKGGGCYYDPRLKRDVIIESFQLKDITPEQITHLNKNVNHYPQPAQAMSTLKSLGLNMPIAIKEGFLYFQPVQGDINFIVPTAFVQRAELRAICSWKSGRNTPEALECMHKQELRPGFIDWAMDLTGLL